MQGLKIVGLCVVAAIVYGIVHDQVTARVCVEYFTVFHPPIFGGTHSPTLLAFGWGVIATWWVGVLLGIPLALAARVGPWPRLAASDLLSMIEILLIVMAACAFVAGVSGYYRGVIPSSMMPSLPPSLRRRFLADWWAHSASYGSGFVGGILLWIMTLRRRMRTDSV